MARLYSRATSTMQALVSCQCRHRTSRASARRFLTSCHGTGLRVCVRQQHCFNRPHLSRFVGNSVVYRIQRICPLHRGIRAFDRIPCHNAGLTTETTDVVHQLLRDRAIACRKYCSATATSMGKGGFPRCVPAWHSTADMNILCHALFSRRSQV